MSARTQKAPSLIDVKQLNLVNGRLHGDRYYGKINHALAVCVYTVGDSPNYFAQMYPLPFPDADMHICFVDFTLTLAKNSDDVTKPLRAQYQYIQTAPDVLTLKCLIHEAEITWREYNARMEDRDA